MGLRLPRGWRRSRSRIRHNSAGRGGPRKLATEVGLPPRLQDVWYIAGHRVEKRFSLFGGRLVVLDAAGSLVAEVALEGGSEWPLEVSGHTYKVVRRARPNAFGVREELLEIHAEDGSVLPRGQGAAEVRPAPADARCAVHADMPATVSCARCGGFACTACATNGAHCAACLTRQVEAERRERAALAWGGGVLPLWFIFGNLAWLLGGIAAFASVAYARRTPRERFSPFVPVLFYALAAAGCIVVRRLLPLR